MSALNDKQGVWFVYDGDCPICTRAADALCIKKEFGSLSTLNAREVGDDPLLDEINRRGFDLDEGMVIYVKGYVKGYVDGYVDGYIEGEFYHGKDALTFMAKHGEAKNIFMLGFRSLFWSDLLSRLMYPWMRGLRNLMLRRRGAGRIDNLSLKNEPTFKAIFGDDWDKLPPVMKKHYGNRPYTKEVTTVEGVLDVFCKPPLLWMAPLMRLLGQIPTFNESNVPVTVHFESDENAKSFRFNRLFNFANRKPYAFQSRMYQLKDNEVIEIMRFGLGWKMQVSWDGDKVILAHKGYAVRLFGHFIPLPLTFLMGAGNAKEYPVDDNVFDMEVNITHPWWGELYGYKGRFEVIN